MLISVTGIMLAFIIIALIASIVGIVFIIIGTTPTDMYTVGLIGCCAITTACLAIILILFIVYYCIG